MFKLFKAAAAAVTLSLAAVSAQAATVEGDFTFAGVMVSSDFSATGGVEVTSDLNTVVVATDDFAGVDVTPVNVDFSAPGTLFDLDNGVSFIADSFFSITSGAFTAIGNLVGGGFDTTVATVDFVGLSFLPTGGGFFFADVTVGDAAPAPVPLPAAGFLLVGALGGLAAAGRRKAKKA